MRMEKTMKMMLKLASGAAVAALVACGGGGGGSTSSGGGTTTPKATKLVYTDPTPASGQWGLKKDAASTDTHLILDLVPPADATSSFGVGLTINAAGGVTWTKPNAADAQLIHNTAYTLGSGAQLIKAAVATNGDLLAGVYQKGLGTTPVAHGAGAVASIALDLKSSATKGSSVTFTVKASQELQATGMQPITLATGSLALQ